MKWTSFKDKDGKTDTFEVDIDQEQLLNYLEKVLGAKPLVVNTPEGGNVTVCYRLMNGVEVGIMLNFTAPTFYLNERVVNDCLLADADFKEIIDSIKLKESGGWIYPHSEHNNPNTTILRSEVKTLTPSLKNRVFVLSQVSYLKVIKLFNLLMK